MYGTNMQGGFADLSAFDTLLEGVPTLPGSTGDTAHVWKPNTPSPHPAMGHSMLTPGPTPVSHHSHMHSLIATTSSSPDPVCLCKQAGPNRLCNNAHQHFSFVQAPCRVDQSAQQPAQSVHRRRITVRLKVPNSWGTTQKPALAQPLPAATPPHSSGRPPPPEHAWAAEQPPQEPIPPRGNMCMSHHRRAWYVRQPGAAAPPPRADGHPPLPAWAPAAQPPRADEHLPPMPTVAPGVQPPPRVDEHLPSPMWAPALQPPHADEHLPPVFTWAPAVQPPCADEHVPLPTWAQAVQAPHADAHPPLPTWAPLVQAPRTGEHLPMPMWARAVQPPRADEHLPSPIWALAMQAPHTTERLRPPKRMLSNTPSKACTEAAHAHATGRSACPAKQRRAGVIGSAAARSSSVTKRCLRHMEPHATNAHTTGVSRERSAGDVGARSWHCEALDNTYGGASKSGVDFASSSPSAKRARTGAGAAGGSSGASGAWVAAQVPQMRAANVGCVPHAGATPATMHPA